MASVKSVERELRNIGAEAYLAIIHFGNDDCKMILPGSDEDLHNLLERLYAVDIVSRNIIDTIVCRETTIGKPIDITQKPRQAGQSCR